ncbi:MAG: GNAT family N-acetyltransferase [Bacillota bacterium]
MGNVWIRRAQLDDAERLLPIQQRAFQGDLERYRDYETNPANEPLAKMQRKIASFAYYAIMIDDQIVGGVEVRDRGEGHYYLGRIYLDPRCQNAGTGIQVMQLIEADFPDARIWTLDTPHLALRNHHFYEKLGYQKVGQTVHSEWLTLFDYRKENPKPEQ